jgi:hypothetical protein
MTQILEFLKSPPGWLLAVVAAILVVEILKMALKIPINATISMLEFFAVFIVGAVILHIILGQEVAGRENPTSPFICILVFVGTTFGSAVLYIIDKRTPTK